MRERISELYRRIHFPSRFRSQFAEWIEAQNWASIDTNSDAGKNQAQDLLDELNQKIESAGVEAQEPYDLEKSLDFLNAKKDFQTSFWENSSKFVRILRDCINEERILIESCQTDNCDLKRKSPSPRPLVEEAEIKQLIESVQHCIYVAERNADELAIMQDKFILEYREITGNWIQK